MPLVRGTRPDRNLEGEGLVIPQLHPAKRQALIKGVDLRVGKPDVVHHPALRIIGIEGNSGQAQIIIRIQHGCTKRMTSSAVGPAGNPGAKDQLPSGDRIKARQATGRHMAGIDQPLHMVDATGHGRGHITFLGNGLGERWLPTLRVAPWGHHSQTRI